MEVPDLEDQALAMAGITLQMRQTANTVRYTFMMMVASTSMTCRQSQILRMAMMTLHKDNDS